MSEKIDYKEIMIRTKMDVDYIAEEAYEKGVKDSQNEVWEAVKKIVLNPDEGGLDIQELDKVFNCCTIQQVFRRYTLSEVIAKLKAYEEKQKTDNGIKVRDEVVWTEDENVAIVVTSVYTTDSMEWCDGVTKDGKAYSILTKNARKTGRRFDIDKILKEMKK